MDFLLVDIMFVHKLVGSLLIVTYIYTLLAFLSLFFVVSASANDGLVSFIPEVTYDVFIEV